MLQHAGTWAAMWDDVSKGTVRHCSNCFIVWLHAEPGSFPRQMLCWKNIGDDVRCSMNVKQYRFCDVVGQRKIK